MLTWNALRAAGFEPDPAGRAILPLVPAPLDPRSPPPLVLGSMHTWNALGAAGFEPDPGLQRAQRLQISRIPFARAGVPVPIGATQTPPFKEMAGLQ